LSLKFNHQHQDGSCELQTLQVPLVTTKMLVWSKNITFAHRIAWTAHIYVWPTV